MTDWSKLKVVDLKAELKRRGLDQKGLKNELINRLIAAEGEDGEESEATLQDDALKLNTDTATSPDTVSPTQPSTLGVEAHEEALQGEGQADPSQQAPEADSEPQQPTFAETANEASGSPHIAAPSQPAEELDAHKSALPSVEPQEAIEDRQKRKRRSQSPPLAALDVARKRFRTSEIGEEESPEVKTTEADANWVEKHNAVDEAEVNAEATEVAASGNAMESEPLIVDSAKEEVIVEKAKEEDEMEGVESTTEQPARTASEPPEDGSSRARDSRFKGLFTSPQKDRSTDALPSSDPTPQATEMEIERDIPPAIHPATSALYIRDFMRPLNPQRLRGHLATLATPPGQDVDTDCIISFYLDPIRTHAFISFTTVSAASRVRSALHDRIWPDERTRKPLWVDFVPVDKVEEWIAEEQSANMGGRSQSKKWELYYDVDEDRNVTPHLQEVGQVPRPRLRDEDRMSTVESAPPPQLTHRPSRSIDMAAPSGPRASAEGRGQRAAANISTLDQLFRSTAATPKLYWMPVSKELANKRLDAIDLATAKEARGKKVDGEINRYTFEDGHKLVDRGPEIFAGIRPPPGYRGRGGGGRGGRGGFGERFGGGGEGGGGGGGGYGGREYDSYRGGRRSPRDDRRY